MIYPDGPMPKPKTTPSPIPAAPSDVAGLVERLKRLRSIPSNPLARSGFGQRVNPDGPEAAALIESLAHDREVMREALDLASRRFYAFRDTTDHTPDRVCLAAWADEARAALASLKGGEK
jgi:hypothetical protein